MIRTTAKRCAVVTGVFVASAWGARAAAAEGDPPIVEAGVDGAADLNANYGWPAGTIQEQLDADATAVPFGKGAIFVPAMTNPLDEPPISVWHGEDRVAEGTTGRRIIVPPGEYKVEVGTGAVEQRFRVDTEVRELMVSVVPVTWAGLAVHMVDDRLNSVRGSYEVIHVATREYVDVGFGADEQAGETVNTWILQPGLYKIVRVGETYRARSSFATVTLLPGKLTDFLLVVDVDTEDFKGAGEVPREELFLAGKGRINWTFVLGGVVNVTSRWNTLTISPGESLSFSAFLDTKLSAMIFDNPLLLRLQIEEGGQIADNLLGQPRTVVIPWRKEEDRADFDGLYVYRLFPWLGPYARFSAETNFFEGVLPVAAGQLRADILDADGNYRRSRKIACRSVRGGTPCPEGSPDAVRTVQPFGSTSINEGLGINLRVFKSLFGETDLRVGFGARHQINRQLIQRLDPQPARNDFPDVPACPEGVICEFYRQLRSSQTIGVEATIDGTLRLTRWVLINAEVYTLIPFDDIENIVLDIKSTLALKLTSFASINYRLRYLRDPALTVPGEDPNRVVNDLQLRFSFSVDLP